MLSSESSASTFWSGCPKPATAETDYSVKKPGYKVTHS